MRGLLLASVVLLLSGCSSSSDTSPTGDVTSEPVKVHNVTMAIGNGNFDITPPATSATFTVNVPANATGIQIALTMTQYAASNLHGDLEGCGAFGAGGGGISIGSGGQSYSSEMCEELAPGSYELTIAVEQGTAQGTWTVRANVPMASKAD